MNALTLRPRPIRCLTPLDEASEAREAIPTDGRYICLNSSHESGHVLGVVERKPEMDCALKS